MCRETVPEIDSGDGKAHLIIIIIIINDNL